MSSMIILGNSFTSVVTGANTDIVKTDPNIVAYFSSEAYNDTESVKESIKKHCNTASIVSIPYDWYTNVQKSYTLLHELEEENIQLLSEQEVIYTYLRSLGKTGNFLIADFGKTTITFTSLTIEKDSVRCEIAYIKNEDIPSKFQKEIVEILTGKLKNDLDAEIYTYLEKDVKTKIEERGSDIEILGIKDKRLGGSSILQVQSNKEELNTYYFNTIDEFVQGEDYQEIILCGNQISLEYYFDTLKTKLKDTFPNINIIYDIGIKAQKKDFTRNDKIENNFIIKIYTESNQKTLKLSKLETNHYKYILKPKLCMITDKDKKWQLPRLYYKTSEEELVEMNDDKPKFKTDFKIADSPICIISYEISIDIFRNTIVQLTNTSQKYYLLFKNISFT